MGKRDASKGERIEEGRHAAILFDRRVVVHQKPGFVSWITDGPDSGTELSPHFSQPFCYDRPLSVVAAGHL